ncbi:MAG TPA: hypothetical protein VFL53_01935 [Pseudolabrys sp.]|nr:hypothetical protein [Pseudolabrys sp.]
MRPLTLAVAAGALLVVTQANAGSFPVNTMTGVESGLVDTVAVRVYVYEGRRYCFYFDGWHGPGWYRCGFAWRRGFGWGGVYGWNDWSYGPWERRHHRHGDWHQHHRGDRDRIGIDSGSTRSRGSFETRSRTRSTTGAGIESNTRVRGESNTRMPSTTGGGGADMRSGNGAGMQGGGNASPSMGGGASAGGGGGANGGGERR